MVRLALAVSWRLFTYICWAPGFIALRINTLNMTLHFKDVYTRRKEYFKVESFYFILFFSPQIITYSFFFIFPFRWVMLNLISPATIFLSQNTNSELHNLFLPESSIGQLLAVCMTSFWSVKMSSLSKSQAGPRIGWKGSPTSNHERTKGIAFISIPCSGSFKSQKTKRKRGWVFVKGKMTAGWRLGISNTQPVPTLPQEGCAGVWHRMLMQEGSEGKEKIQEKNSQGSTDGINCPTAVPTFSFSICSASTPQHSPAPRFEVKAKCRLRAVTEPPALTTKIPKRISQLLLTCVSQVHTPSLAF